MISQLISWSRFTLEIGWAYKCELHIQGKIEELTIFSQCQNTKTGSVKIWSVYQSFLYWIIIFHRVHFQKILEVEVVSK